MPVKKKTILQKLQNARDKIKKLDLKKAGRNDYSKFDYYTPEQVESLVEKACRETKTICLCNLNADEHGLYQQLIFRDLESEQSIDFRMRTKHGTITATNEAQQMGGTDTYSERYIKMKTFQIKDNNIDPDNNSGKPVKQPVQPIQPIQATPVEPVVNKIVKTDEEIQAIISTATNPLELKNLFSKYKDGLTEEQVQMFSRSNNSFYQ